MGRGVEVPSDALVTAYADWQEQHVSYCPHCDREVKRGWDGDMFWELAYPEDADNGDTRFCQGKYTERVGDYGVAYDEAREDCEHGGWDYDQDNFQNDLEATQEAITATWPSTYASSGSYDYFLRETSIIAENQLVYFVIAEYCGTVAISIVPKYEMAGLAAQWVRQIESTFLQMFSDRERVGSMSNGEAVYARV